MKRLFGLLLITLTTTIPAQASVIKSGSFYDYVEVLKSQAFAKNSGLYAPPSLTQRSDFSELAKSLYDHNWASAEIQANNLDYDLIQFTNTTTSDVYWGVTEQLVAGEQSKGWGSFFINESARTNVTIEVPHPIADTNTHLLGASVFERSGANGFIISGAHRDTNGNETANPTSLPFSIFQEVHEVWNGGFGNSTAWQLHGFGSSTASRFPLATDAVLSDGLGNVTDNLQVLDRLLEEVDDAMFGNAYVYNQLAVDNYLNELVNGIGQDGQDFSALRAFNNPQGQFSNAAGGTFVHIEASFNIRGNFTRRNTFANAIVAAIDETSQGPAGHVPKIDVPEPATTSSFLFGLLALGLFQRKNKIRSTSTTRMALT